MRVVWNGKIFVLIAVSVGCIASIFFYWRDTIRIIETNTVVSVAFKNPVLSRLKNPQRVIKGLYLTAYSAGNPQKLDEIINLIERTELNAVVIDIKDYSGKILFATRNSLARTIQATDNQLGDTTALLQKLHAHNIYVIARQTVFQDPLLAEHKPEWAIRNKSGGVWRDHKGLSWVDPTRSEVWHYNLSIAKEAIRFGFDEINFDYVRFPSDGDMRQVVYNIGTRARYEIMADFYNFLNVNLSVYPAWLSLDMFGFVMEKTGVDDMNIGQRLADAIGVVDYVCPMMYPSHYPAGHLGLSNPAVSPGVVVANGMQLGATQFIDQRALVRPWLQAFNVGAIYDAQKIRAQIDAVEKYPNAGWLLWNAKNRYDASGLN